MWAKLDFTLIDDAKDYKIEALDDFIQLKEHSIRKCIHVEPNLQALEKIERLLEYLIKFSQKR